jgi:hypothetical protein
MYHDASTCTKVPSRDFATSAIYQVTFQFFHTLQPVTKFTKVPYTYHTDGTKGILAKLQQYLREGQ